MAEPSKVFNINLRIGKSIFPVTALREDEEMYRDAEKLINERLNHYASIWPDLGTERHLMMALLDLAVKQIKLEYRNDTEPYKKLMTDLQKEIEQTLNPDK
jgi:cell division protein ZapA